MSTLHWFLVPDPNLLVFLLVCKEEKKMVLLLSVSLFISFPLIFISFLPDSFFPHLNLNSKPFIYLFITVSLPFTVFYVFMNFFVLCGVLIFPRNYSHCKIQCVLMFWIFFGHSLLSLTIKFYHHFKLTIYDLSSFAIFFFFFFTLKLILLEFLP